MLFSKSARNTSGYVTKKARNVLSVKLGDITVGAAYFYLILISMLANLFTFLIGWAVAKAKGLGLERIPMQVKLPTSEDFY